MRTDQLLLQRHVDDLSMSRAGRRCLHFACRTARLGGRRCATTPAPASGYNYPTQGPRRIRALSCMDDNGHDFANVYKCSCVIDQHGDRASLRRVRRSVHVLRSTRTLGGEGGAEFRVDHAKAQTKKFRALQADAYRSLRHRTGDQDRGVEE